MKFEFVEATREQLQLRMALTGVSGGGKTFTALALMTYLLGDGPSADMTKRIAVIDSERGSSRRYARGKPFNFSVLELKTFSPETYVEAMKAAAKAGFEGLIIDSLSHEWAGTEGALEQKDKAGGTFAAWGKITPRHNAVIDTIMSLPMHVIGTMRSKQAHEQTEDEKGKKVVKKLGLQPIQRDGIEYEFDIVGDMDDGAITINKSRCVDLKGKKFYNPGQSLAQEILGWLSDGEAAAPPQAPANDPEVAAFDALTSEFEAQIDAAEGDALKEIPEAAKRVNLPPAFLGRVKARYVARVKALRSAPAAEARGAA